MARIRMETLAVDVSVGDWPTRRAQLCRFVGVGAEEPPGPSLTQLAAFTGRYGDGQREVAISLEDGRLSDGLTFTTSDGVLLVGE